MIEIFNTDEGRNFWVSQSAEIHKIYSKVKDKDFLLAVKAAKQIRGNAELLASQNVHHPVDDVLNDLFMAGNICDLLEEYGLYWIALSDGKFGTSWDHLQNIQDILRLLLKFGNLNGEYLLRVFEKQCECLELAYPYRIFASIEMIHDELECNICGTSVLNSNCPHIMGSLYRGKLAVGIIRKVRKVIAAALVNRPRDKRCTIQVPDNSNQFHTLACLRTLMAEGRFHPLIFLRADQTTRMGPLEPLDASARNKPCPCGSGVKYKKCCHKKTHEHLNFVVSTRPVFTADDILGPKL